MRIISMSTVKQIEANRENAKRSTGPRTPQGKSASSRNALKHGLYAEQLLLPFESEKEFEEHAAGFRDEYQPSTPTAHTLVNQIIWSSWLLRRFRILEANYYDQRTAELDNEKPRNEYDMMTYVFRFSDNILDSMSRQQARVERSFYRALHELQRVGQVSDLPIQKLQNKPNSPPNPIIPFTTPPADLPLIEPTPIPATPIK